MPSEPFQITKEQLIEWLNDDQYLSEFKKHVYKSIMRFYFDTFFKEISPAKRAVVDIEKDLGVSIEKDLLLNVFYYDYWARKRRKEERDVSPQAQTKNIIEEGKPYASDTLSDTPPPAPEPPSEPFIFKNARDLPKTEKKHLFKDPDVTSD